MLDGMNTVMNELRSYVLPADNKWTATELPRVSMVNAEACANQIYQPMLHFVLQGEKTLSIGGQMYRYTAGTYFLVPVDMPATGEIFADGPDKPFQAVSLTLDAHIIASLLAANSDMPVRPANDSFAPVATSPELLDAWLRMMRLLARPGDATVLAPMIEREILFRVLQGPSGDVLRNIACPDGHLSQIRRSINWIGDHYAEPLRAEALAGIANMSVAAYYRHFKAITHMTPIQYQKQLRLIRARWLLIFEPSDVAIVAFSVGYESASQFSREYARLFGRPPARDAARFRSLPTLPIAHQAVPQPHNLTD
ncbi:AraC family transcriptional regulator [Erwinia billingiae]|uniref:AraC family transcriptional regulator n=1 Tax=Erwinia billingiae TaxID=182337 RepID=UPI003207AF0A